MKNKKFKIILIILALLIIIALITYFVLSSKKEKEEIAEYIPEEEISDEQMRQTMVSLFYKNKETGQIMPEARVIDVKLLLENPYDILVNMLIGKPKNEQLENCIPEGTILLDTAKEGDCVILNFSKDFVENQNGGKEEEEKTITSIVNTLTELNEVNSVKIKIEGEENCKFKSGEITFEETFTRKK